MTAVRRAVVDAVASRIWGPNGGRYDQDGPADEIAGARWTVRELAACLGEAWGCTVHRTTIYEALRWLLSRGVLARAPTGDADQSFRYLICPYDRWTRAASVKPGDAGYPLTLQNAARAARQDTPNAAVGGPTASPAASEGDGTDSDPSQGPQRPPGLPPFFCGRSGEGVSMFSMDDRAGTTKGSETLFYPDPLFHIGAHPVDRPSPAPPPPQRRAPRHERASAWYVVVTTGRQKQRRPLWTVAQELAGPAWDRIRSHGPTGADAVSVADALSQLSDVTWHPAAVIDALRLAVDREQDGRAIAEALEAKRVATVANRASERARQLLAYIPDNDAGAVAAAGALHTAVLRLHDPDSHGERELCALIVEDKADVLAGELARIDAAAAVAAAVAAKAQKAAADYLKTDEGRAKQADHAAEFSGLIEWARERPRPTMRGPAAAGYDRARARERDRDAVLLWLLTSRTASPADMREVGARIDTIKRQQYDNGLHDRVEQRIGGGGCSKPRTRTHHHGSTMTTNNNAHNQPTGRGA